MENVSLLLAVSPAHGAVLEKLILHALPDAVVLPIATKEELKEYLQTDVPTCIIIDWDCDAFSPPYCPRIIRRDDRFKETHFIAVVSHHEQLIAAYAASYDFVVQLDNTREAYYNLASYLQLIQRLQVTLKNVRTLQYQVTKAYNDNEQLTRIIERIISLRIPEASFVSSFARNCARWIAERLAALSPSYSLDYAQLDIAARLYAIGRLYLSDSDIQKPIARDGAATTYATSTVPEIAAELLSYYVDFQEARSIMLTMYENYDGTGFPHRRQSWQIPIGARILRAVIDFAELIYRDGYSQGEAISIMQQLSRRIYDIRVVQLLDEYIARFSAEFNCDFITPTSVTSLSAGMTLGRDIVTVAGHKLAIAGTTLTELQVERIRSHHTVDPIVGTIYVVRHAQ